MPLPLFLGIGAAIAGAAGVGTGIHGAVKMKEANDTMNAAKNRHNANIAKFKQKNTRTTKAMDQLGKLELDILHSFGDFSDVFEKIQNRPVFTAYSKNGVNLPTYDGEKIKEVSVGAGVLLGGLGGAGLGAAGGFAAAGATTAAVMALGTASTGTAIASLSGVAATNATLAALGGGALAARRGSVGFWASAGMAQAPPNFFAPSMRPSVQYFCASRWDIFHFWAASRTVMYSMEFLQKLDCFSIICAFPHSCKRRFRRSPLLSL